MALLARSNEDGFFRRRSKLRLINGVLSATELEREFERERARVDRNDHQFSVAVFLQEEHDQEALVQLAEVLLKRTRTPDVIGRLDSERLAALLPETDSQGAWNFADDVTRMLAERSLKFDCLVHTYPADTPSTDDGNRTNAEKSESSDTSQEQAGVIEGEDETTKKRLAAKARKPRPGRPRLVEDDDRSVAAIDSSTIRTAGDRPVQDLGQYFRQEIPVWKRALDIFVSLVMLVILAPLLLCAALAVRLTSPGPIIFKQQRAGLGGKPFTMYKFRSMHIDAEERRKELEDLNELDGPVFKIRDDPRMTPIGRVLRRASIDELPQLYNVLIGDMTLVGPRPPMLNEIASYEQWQLARLDLKGGLTCIWQVSGRSEIDFEDWIRMDLRYVKTRNWLLDLGLLSKTAKAVVSGRGAF